MAKKIGGLGKGLSAIFIENDTEDKNEVVTLKISQVEPNRKQPRRSFDDESLAELAESIRQHGVLQPILVRPQIFGGYQIVAGERRYRASRLAGLTEIPAIIRELSDSETMQIALIENLQRSDLTPLEEAAGYRSLIDDFGFSQEDVARTVGKSRPAVANMLRLLSLPDEVKPMLEQQELSVGHARALLAIEDEKAITAAAKKVAQDKLSVRETEALVKKLTSAKPQAKKEKPKQPTIYREVELTLEQELGTKVSVIPFKNTPGGTLCVEFYEPSELFKLTAKLTDLWNRPEES
jgi:ParB family chromosome partitioning protein